MAELAVVSQDILESIDMTNWERERKLVWKLARENGTKIETIAREVGFSRSQVSRYINDDSFKPSDEFVEAVRVYLKRLGIWDEETPQAEPESLYIKSVKQLDMLITEAWKRTWYVLDTAWKAKNFGMVVGPSGCGKTSAVQCWMERPDNFEKAILITANGCMTRKAILKRIAKAIGIWASADSDTLVERICAELKERPRLIIIDEADQLSSEGKLEILRTILDGTKNIGIVLIGNEDLSEYILRMAVDKRKLARIHNRFGAYQQVNMPTREEALRLLERVNLTNGAREKMISIIRRKHGDGGLRVARTMLSIIFEAIGDKQITEDLLRSPALQGAVLSANA